MGHAAPENHSMKFVRTAERLHISADTYGVPASGYYNVEGHVIADMFGPYPTIVGYVIRRANGTLTRAYLHYHPDKSWGHKPKLTVVS
jgi:hypothetical protein